MTSKPLLTKDIIDRIRETIGLNFDARNYFFSKADERWLLLLWKNGLMDEIKKKSEDPTKYFYRMPELDYLARVAEKTPKEVVDIMLEVPINTRTFNPETVDRFLWICSKLPADQLARMVPKIRDENWVKLMGGFSHWGFEYEKTLNILASATDSKNLIILAEAVLTIKTKEEIKKDSNGFGVDNPFYFKELSYTKIFEYLSGVDVAYQEDAFMVIIKTLSDYIQLGDENEEKERIFKIDETLSLYDVDFFTIELGSGSRHSVRDDVRELAATAKTIIRNLIGKKCSDESLVRYIYEKYIKHLPDSRSAWRFKLYVISLCPTVFKTEIKEQIFKLFDYKQPGDILSGAEYERLIQIGLPTIDEPDQRSYISKAITFFKEHSLKESGRDIISCAIPLLTKKEIKDAEDAFGQLTNNYVPQPSIVGSSIGGMVVPRSPGSEDDWAKPVPEIIQRLKTDWSPTSLSEKPQRHEDFLHPIDAEGLRERLKLEMATRPSDFFDVARLFFDRETLDSHYTYSFLRNLYDLIRENKIPKGINFSEVLNLVNGIIESASEKNFEPRPEERKGWHWIAYWDSVNTAIGDLVQEMLKDNNGKLIIDFPSNRDFFFNTIKYLFGVNDPQPKDEKLETAKHKTKTPPENEFTVSDPYTTAINSVRGRAFEALLMFVHLDGKEFPKEAIIKLKPDVKELYEQVLKNEQTRAIMFMFGRFVADFYFRDIKWMRSLFAQIFPTDETKKHLYLAGLEGYLSTGIYEELFFDPFIQNLYERGLELTGDEDSKRRYFKEPDEGIPTHFALAFMHYEPFGFDHLLFKKFWSTDSANHSEFVSFIGRMFISGSNARADRILETEPMSKQRLKDLWDWLLVNYEDPKIFSEFGFWISLEKNIFDPTWLAEHVRKTLEKTKGDLDWNHGLTQSIIGLANASPTDILTTAELYFLENGVRSGAQKRMPLRVDHEWFEALKIIYANPKTKSGVYSLIDNLIREGGSAFWNLKAIINTK